MSKTEIEFDKLDSLTLEERLKAIVRLLIPIIVSVVGCFGISLDAESIWGFACAIIGAGSTVYLWWYKNNNLTKAAAISQRVLNDVKKEMKDNVS